MKIIPSPQKAIYTLAKDGIPPKDYVTNVFADEDLKQSAKKGFALLQAFQYVEQENAELIVTCDHAIAETYFQPDTLWFQNKNAAEQGYIIKGCSDGKIILYAQQRVGIMYALATFVQLPVLKPEFEIKDYPDYRIRANKWLLWAESGIVSYDCGDGLEGMRKRVLRGLDICLKYKINAVIFDGFGFDTHRYEGYDEFVRFCTKEARARGIYLINGGYTMGYGLSGFSFGKYYGEVYKNRHSYPDGEEYECLGTFIWPDQCKGQPFLRARQHGTCISNDALTDMKIEEIANYVKGTGIGGLYLHNMDSSLVHEDLWKARCEKCKNRWPNDDIFAKDGMAGAFAYFFDKISSALKKIHLDDYNSEKDLLLFFVAPGYAEHQIPDEQVRNIARFWRAVTDFMDVKENVFPTFRELFYNHEDNQRRFPDIFATQWRKDMEFAIVDFNGSDGFHSDKLFSVAAIFHFMFQGASAILTCNGHVFQQPLQVFNAEYMWNSENSAFYQLKNAPKDFLSFIEIYTKCQKTEFRPKEIYGDGGMLDVICEKLYGVSGKTMAKVFKLCGKNYECPIPYLCNVEIQTNGSRPLLPYRWDNVLESDTIVQMISSFGEMGRLTQEAKALLKALETDDPDIITYRKMLEVSAPVVDMWHSYMKLYKVLDDAFRGGRKPNEEILMQIDAALNNVSKLKAWYQAQKFSTVDSMNGALCKAEEMFALLHYNLELMRKSIMTGKRIPDDRKEQSIGQWW